MATSKNIQLLRLVSGEEIIGSVADLEDCWYIEDAIVMIPAGEGKIGFMPWMPYTKAKDGVEIPKKHVMFSVEPIDDLKDQWRQTTTGLVVPNSGGLGIVK